MSEPATTAPSTPAPPTTGMAAVDAALAEVADLSQVPLDEHHDRLQAAQEVLARVLETSRDQLQAPIPGLPGPRLS